MEGQLELRREQIPELPSIVEPYGIPRLPEAAQNNHVAPNTFLQSAMLLTIKNDEQKKEVFLRIC